MKKMLMSLPVMLALAFSVMALSFTGTGGDLKYLGSNGATDYGVVPTAISFSSSASSPNSGNGELTIYAIASNGDNLVLDLDITVTRFREGVMIPVPTAGTAVGTLWTNGVPTPISSEFVEYSFSPVTKKATIKGTGDVKFQVTQIAAMQF